jgi:AraC family transcriptional regulator
VSATSSPWDEVVFRGPSVTVGAFRCAKSDPSFSDTGPIDNFVFVFPRRTVRLCHDGGRPFLADPASVTLYNRGQRYSRQAVSAAGDESDWFAVAPELLVEAVSQFDAAIRDRPQTPFRYAFGPCAAATYLAQRALFEELQAGDRDDVLRIEETVLELLSQVLSTTYAFWREPPAADRASRRQLAAVDHVRRLLAERLGDALRLADLSRAVGLSPFHLCRAFRAVTGSTLHVYRNRIRLHQALELVSAGEDLTQTALELGYSSHSHFTSAFRRMFGLTPSAARSQRRRAT